MKRISTLLIAILFFSAGLTLARPELETKKPKKFFASAAVFFLLPADANFREIYGKHHFVPNIKAGLFISPQIYLWCGYGFFSTTGEIDIYDIKIEAKAKQAFISFGAGYRGILSGKTAYRVEAGAVSFKYEEEAMAKTVSASSYGFKWDAGLSFNFSRFFFGELFAAYMSGSKNLAGRAVKTGGFTAGIGLGIRF